MNPQNLTTLPSLKARSDPRAALPPVEMTEAKVISEVAFTLLRGWCGDNPHHMDLRVIAQAVEKAAFAYGSTDQDAMSAANVDLINRITVLRNMKAGS